MKISLEPYKGVRDFYPGDQAVENYIFSVWKKTAESFGYSEYNASTLEPLELYKSKTSEEIVNSQIYSFKDRGDREVALRPEMTPTVARMIAARTTDFPAPVRWYSVANFFRYERPQRGRFREFWQLNADIFGVFGIAAEAEIISLASGIMKAFGAKEEDFEIRINSRKLLEDIYQSIGVKEEKKQIISRIVDKKDKISKEAFKEALEEELGDSAALFASLLENKDGFFEKFGDLESLKELKEVMDTLWADGVKNVVFSPALTRGFDYYTGLVFEIYDSNPENPRALFGGGRYDNLIGSLGGKDVPAVGFGMGDVTARDYLETHKLIPNLPSSTDIWIAVAPETDMKKVNEIASKLRANSIKVGVDISGKKLPDQLKSLEKRKISFVMVVGPEELEKGIFKIRNTTSREEKEGNIDEIVGFLK